MKWPAVKDLHGDQIVTEGSVRATGAGPGRTGRRQNAKPAGRSAMILAIPAALLVLALIVAPQLWITSVMKRHGSQRPAIPWTGRAVAPAAVRRLQVPTPEDHRDTPAGAPHSRVPSRFT